MASVNIRLWDHFGPLIRWKDQVCGEQLSHFTITKFHCGPSPRSLRDRRSSLPSTFGPNHPSWVTWGPSPCSHLCHPRSSSQSAIAHPALTLVLSWAPLGAPVPYLHLQSRDGSKQSSQGHAISTAPCAAFPSLLSPASSRSKSLPASWTHLSLGSASLLSSWPARAKDSAAFYHCCRCQTPASSDSFQDRWPGWWGSYELPTEDELLPGQWRGLHILHFAANHGRLPWAPLHLHKHLSPHSPLRFLGPIRPRAPTLLPTFPFSFLPLLTFSPAGRRFWFSPSGRARILWSQICWPFLVSFAFSYLAFFCSCFSSASWDLGHSGVVVHLPLGLILPWPQGHCRSWRHGPPCLQRPAADFLFALALLQQLLEFRHL